MGDRRWPTALAILSATVLAASACGGSAQSDTPNGGEDAAEEQELIYVEAITGDPGGLNPQFAGGPIVNRITFSVYESLVEITDQYEIVPALAQDWEISDDERSITFHLEQGVQWHDGEPFTSSDVAFNFEEIMPL
ncbi:MAG TPA: ABC transporter substrate-binding protein, partial [Actinomycetaceae bacterium]|nr:ABC transporter substrate-binding protein [Actinomycetaceae bacterium]